MDAKERAIWYLSRRPCTRKQLCDYLRRKDYGEEEIREAADEMEAYRYLDDRRYCRLFLESGFEKGRGIVRLRRELRERGIDADLIEEALQEMEEDQLLPDETEAARQIACSVTEPVDIQSMDYKEKEKLKAKIARKLFARGYSQDIIYQVIREVIGG